jgi:LysR family transcriptional regulator, glycine cleavage system transcriptional activator
MWSEIPSLSSLRAFAALASTGSYTKAGAVLNVTQAAVSQQVKSLETWLGVSLVNRSGRGIVLTTEGNGLARGLDTGFAVIRDSLEALTKARATRPVQITMSPAFAAEWMLPRISEFQDLHPEITLMLNPTVEIMDLKSGGIDLAIRYKDRRTEEKEGYPILVFDAVVIGSPELLGEHTLNDPRNLIDVPWLEELGTNDVADWFERQGVELDRMPTITRMPGNLITQSIRRGDGISHTLKDYFIDDIRSGTVVTGYREPAFGAFYIHTAPGPVRPAVKTFLSWLKTKTANNQDAGD